MKFGVIVFPGSNCDDDMIHVLGTVMEAEVRKIWHKEHSLDGFGPDDVIILPGGFSYGDYVRAGAIASHSPIIQAVRSFAKAGGIVWGICNGFQVLCEMELLPGTLLRNQQQKFISKSVELKTVSTKSPISAHLKKGQLLRMPVAHADGRYYAPADEIRRLFDEEQVIFQYSDANGQVNEATNINGSVENIAGICNHSRNIIGMMPHPERAAERILGEEDGRKLFASLLQTSVSV